MAKRLVFRSIKTTRELEEFQQSYATWSGLTLPLDFLATCEVTGVFRGEELLGGWVLTAHGRSRAVELLRTALPDPSLAARRVVADWEAQLVTELTGVWLDPRQCGHALAGRFWLELSRQIVHQHAPYVIFGFKMENKGLERLYGRVQPVTIHRGPVRTSGDRLNSFANVTIQIAKRQDFKWVVLRGLLYLGARALRRHPRAARAHVAPERLTSLEKSRSPRGSEGAILSRMGGGRDGSSLRLPFTSPQPPRGGDNRQLHEDR